MHCCRPPGVEGEDAEEAPPGADPPATETAAVDPAQPAAASSGAPSRSRHTLQTCRHVAAVYETGCEVSKVFSATFAESASILRLVNSHIAAGQPDAGQPDVCHTLQSTSQDPDVVR